MTNVLELLADIGSPDRRKEVAEYINAHPHDFDIVLDSIFTGTANDRTQVKQRILDLIDLLNPKIVIRVIERVITDSDARIRVRGLQAAYRTRIDSFNPMLVSILSNEEEEFEVRKWAVHILGSTDPESYGRVLRKTARDMYEDVNLRKEAIFALTKVADDETLGTLCALLGDPNIEIRASGAWALNNMGMPESINCLFAALEDESEEVRNWAIRGLRDMDNTKALQGLADAITRVPPSEQVRMIHLLVERRSEIILRAITELLGSEDIEVLRVAAWAIGVSPYPPAIPALTDLLKHEDEQVCNYAKIALARSGVIDSTDINL